jgi:hypothetical protein
MVIPESCSCCVRVCVGINNAMLHSDYLFGLLLGFNNSHYLIVMFVFISCV